MKCRERHQQLSWSHPELRILCALLCILIVTLVLTSCRRQRSSHVENVEAADEGETESGPVNPIILNGAQIYNGHPVHAFSNQLLLHVATTQAAQDGDYLPYNGVYLVTLRIILPTNEEVVWKDLPVGARRVLEIEGAEYLVDVTEVDVHSARISITRKL